MRSEWEQAVLKGDMASVERLAAAGVDLDSRDAHGQTALILAALHGQTAVVNFLIARGADLDHTAKYHLSALMLAVVNSHEAIARALAAAGADLSIRGTGAPGFHNLTAADLAAARGAHELASILRASIRE